MSRLTLCAHASGCTKYATHGIPGQGPTRCLEHHEVGKMVRTPNKRCEEPHCCELAVCGLNEGRKLDCAKRKHCNEHKKEGETNLLS